MDLRSRSFLLKKVRSITSLIWWRGNGTVCRTDTASFSLMNSTFVIPNTAAFPIIIVLRKVIYYSPCFIFKIMENYASIHMISLKGTRDMDLSMNSLVCWFYNLNARCPDKQHSSIIQTVFIISLTAILGSCNFNRLYIY